MRLLAGALAPPITIGLRDGGDPIPNLDDYAVTMVGKLGVDDAYIVDDDPTIDAAAGTVAHIWVDGETDTPGRIYWTVQVDFGAGLIIFGPDGPAGVTDIE